jgi:hypothetical protein
MLPGAAPESIVDGEDDAVEDDAVDVGGAATGSVGVMGGEDFRAGAAAVVGAVTGADALGFSPGV